MNHLGDIAKMMLRVRIRLRVDRVVIAGVGMLDDGHGIAQQPAKMACPAPVQT